MGKIYDIKASTLETPKKFVFTKPIDIALTYSSSETGEEQKELSVYFYNEQNINWDKLIGEHDANAKSIRISTNQTGKYALFDAAEKEDDLNQEPVSSSFIDIKGH